MQSDAPFVFTQKKKKINQELLSSLCAKKVFYWFVFVA